MTGWTTAPSPTRRGWLVDLAVASVLTLLILGPAILPGYVLRGDMVFVPRQPWKPEWLGLDGSFPRAVPMDALVSVLTAVVPGWVVQKGFLVAALVGGGLGAGRLTASWPWPGRAAAVTLFLWNPYVAERILIGQWALVVGYALLPWVVLAAVRAGRDLRTGWEVLLLALAASAVASPSSGLMAGFVATVVLSVARTWRAASVSLAATAVVNLPWLLPALAADAEAPAGRDQLEAFAARAESDLPTLVSLLSLGGIWKTSVVPEERTLALVVALSAGLMVAAFAAAIWAARRCPDRAPFAGLAVVAVTSILLALLPTTAGGVSVLTSAIEVVPGLGILRDSHRYLAPTVLVLLPGVATLVTGLTQARRPGREALGAVAALVAAAPLLLLPSLAWGASGDLPAVDYPDEWAEVADLVAAEPPARTVVLPWTGSYRGFGWNDYRAMLDPAPRFLPGEVLVDDRVLLGEGRVLAGESRTGAEVSAALRATDPAERAARLRALGVRWVLVEKGHATGRPPQGRVRFDGEWLQLVDLGGGSRPPSPPVGRVVALVVVGADLVVVTLVLIAVSRVTMRASRRI